ARLWAALPPKNSISRAAPYTCLYPCVVFLPSIRRANRSIGRKLTGATLKRSRRDLPVRFNWSRLTLTSMTRYSRAKPPIRCSRRSRRRNRSVLSERLKFAVHFVEAGVLLEGRYTEPQSQ